MHIYNPGPKQNKLSIDKENGDRGSSDKRDAQMKEKRNQGTSDSREASPIIECFYALTENSRKSIFGSVMYPGFLLTIFQMDTLQNSQCTSAHAPHPRQLIVFKYRNFLSL